MPIDRPAILRNAEKLLRQGKLELAIGEYLRIVEDQPSDWNTANVLGDLYVRARQTDRAVEHFVRIAEHLHTEGFLPKAAAVYKKVLKLKPDHEQAMLQAGEIAGKQGLAADARALFNAVAERRRARRDERGVAEIVVRLAALDPNDFEARLTGARTRATLLDDLPGAVADLRTLAAYMQEKERQDEALLALQEASALDPEDAEVRAQLRGLLVARGDLSDAHGAAPALQDVERLGGGTRDEVAFSGSSIVESDGAPGFDVVQPAADAAPARAQLADASIAAGQGEDVGASESMLADVEPPAVGEAGPAAGATFELERLFEEVAVAPAAKGRTSEVDLSLALDEIRRHTPPEAARPFEVSADENYRLGLSLYDAGKVEEAVAPLKAASRAPKLRFLTASLLGRICRDRGELADAIEWFERAAQAPAPTPEQGHLLLFDLAEALEGAGETARALAICMELKADAGNYRDVAARIDRLAKVRARG